MAKPRILGIAKTAPTNVFTTIDPKRYIKKLVVQGSPVATPPEEIEPWIAEWRELNNPRPVLLVLSGRPPWVREYLDACPSVHTWIVCVHEPLLAELGIDPIDGAWSGGRQIDLDEVLDPAPPVKKTRTRGKRAAAIGGAVVAAAIAANQEQKQNPFKCDFCNSRVSSVTRVGLTWDGTKPWNLCPKCYATNQRKFHITDPPPS